MVGLRARFGHLLAAPVVVPVLLAFTLAVVAAVVTDPSAQLAVVMLLAVTAGVAIRSVTVAQPARDQAEELDRARRTLYAARFALLDGADPRLAQPYALAAVVCNTLAHRAQLLTAREATELGERLSQGTVSIRDIDELIDWLTEEIGDVAPEVSAELHYEEESQPLRNVVTN